MPDYSLDFPYAFGKPNGLADFRVEPQDFVVIEDLGFELNHSGEHIYLQICKTSENTAWVADKIAQIADVKNQDVSYAGRKDRHAITTQWFSVYQPKLEKQLDWAQLSSETIKILAVDRHTHKLRRGDHASNFFQIRLRNIAAEFHPEINEKLSKIFSQGVPNYFGEQRFGHDGNNLRDAEALLAGNSRVRDAQKRGLILSAARSYLFNLVLAERVQEKNWLDLLAGDSESFPSGPLWGRGRLKSQEATHAVEMNALGDWVHWSEALEHVGLQQERRALVLMPIAGEFEWQNLDLTVRFSLESGEFATSVLRELVQLKSAVAL